jgi:hypothetical protein
MSGESISVKIAREARLYGLSYGEAASRLGKRAAAARRARKMRRQWEAAQEAKFEAMKAARPDLY